MARVELSIDEMSALLDALTICRAQDWETSRLDLDALHRKLAQARASVKEYA